MKLNLALSALSVVGMLAAGPSMAANATVGTTTGAVAGANGGTVSTDTTTTTSTNANVASDHGVSALGMDISAAGNTATSVQSFTSTLTPAQQTSLKTRCQVVIAAPDKASADVLAFCKNSMM